MNIHKSLPSFAKLIATACAFGFLQFGKAAEPAAAAAANPGPSAGVYEPLPLGAVEPAGWILAQMTRDATSGLAAHFTELWPNYGSRSYLEKDGNLGCGEMTGNWADGYIRMAYLTGAESARKKADAFVRDILSSRDSDGYLGNVAAKERYNSARTGELWMQSRLYVALLAYYELTGDKQVLDAVVTATKLTMSKYGPAHSPMRLSAQERDAGEPCKVDGHALMFVDVLEWLYRLTADRSYVEFARFLYDDFSGSTDTMQRDVQLGSLLEMKYPFFWHGVHTAEHLRVPLFLAATGAGAPYGQASDNAFEKLRNYIVPSGSCASDESIYNHTPVASQAYEYCTTTELCTSLAKTGRPAYADMVERAVFNAAQGARTADGKYISYLSSDTRPSATEDHDLPYTGKKRFKLSPAHDVGGACCSANAVKIMPYYTSSMWMKSIKDGGIAALLLGPSRARVTMNGVRVTIEENTSYPFSDSITFAITADKPVGFPITVRIPAWSGAVKVDAPGATIASGNGVRVITKTWQTGDSFKIEFENPIVTTKLADGDLAVYRGALLFVQPWPSKLVQLPRKFKVPGFFDYDVVPVTHYEISPEFIDCAAKDAGLTLQHPKEGDEADPWAKPPVILEAAFRSASPKENFRHSCRLIPMGASLLRFAGFRVWPFDDAYFRLPEKYR